MNSGQYHALADSLALAVTDPDSAATAELMASLGRLAGPGWLRVDESARRYYARPELHGALAGWQPRPGAAVPLPRAVAASMAHNGRVREMAVSALAGVPGPVASAALAVRVADWVPEVSAAASAVLASRTGLEDAAAVIPVLLGLRRRQCGREAAARYLAGIAAGPEETLRALAGPWRTRPAHDETTVRRVRRLPSGRYQARYPGPDGVDRPAQQTFASWTDANVWLTMKEAEIRRAEWADPDAGKIRFGDYADTWINDHVFKPRTEELYRALLKNHLMPGKVDLGKIHEGAVRRWRKERLTAGPKQAHPFGPVTVAKAYRLLHAIMTTAVEDGAIRHNPCHIKGAGQEHSDERPVVPVAVLVELLDQVPARYRALLLLATFANLRFGELAALRRDQVDLDACEVRVSASMAQLNDGQLVDGDPKSRAGNRTVSFPADIVPELADHLERFVSPGPASLVFIGPKGGRLRRQNFGKLWDRARGKVGMPGLHFHDLRHTGNTMAAAQGASLRELMERMGHSSPRAALVYLHATRERDQQIAAGMGKIYADAKRTRTKRTGTPRRHRARNGHAVHSGPRKASAKGSDLPG